MNKDDLYRELAIAVELREDGEYEDSVEILKKLSNKFPYALDVAEEYIKSLRRKGNYLESNSEISRILSHFPNESVIYSQWAALPTQINDYSEVISRARILRDKFCKNANSPEWTSLTVEFDALYESGQWRELSKSIHSNEEIILNNPHVLPAGLVSAGKLFNLSYMRHIIKAASPEAWKFLPPNAKKNISFQTDIAFDNRLFIEKSGLKIVSIGQNCLPYQMLGRWGLLGLEASSNDLTPFDLGGFTGDNAAQAIVSDFSEFEDINNFVITPAWGGGEMFTHRPTGVGFFHERGPYWLNNVDLFKERLHNSITNWRNLKRKSNILFVYSLCGQGNIENIWNALSYSIKENSNHILVIDVREKNIEVPHYDHLSYKHIPYPKNYDWTGFDHQVSDRGVAFEQNIVSTVCHEINKICSYADKYIPKILKREKESQYPEDKNLVQDWVSLPMSNANWEESINRSRIAQSRITSHALSEKSLLLADELKCLCESGKIEEARSLIDYNSELVTNHEPLLTLSLNFLGSLSDIDRIKAFISKRNNIPSPKISPVKIENIFKRLNKMSKNLSNIRKNKKNVVCLGHDAKSSLLTAHWGLKEIRKSDNDLNIFETISSDVSGILTVIENDFRGFDDWDQFDIIPAWFGGLMPIHKETGICFYAQRRHKWSNKDIASFLENINTYIDNWREDIKRENKIFYISVFDKGLVDKEYKHFINRIGDIILDNNSYIVASGIGLPKSEVMNDRIFLKETLIPPDYIASDFVQSCSHQYSQFEQSMLENVMKFIES